MAKPTNPRHRKSGMKPVTINLKIEPEKEEGKATAGTSSSKVPPVKASAKTEPIVEKPVTANQAKSEAKPEIKKDTGKPSSEPDPARSTKAKGDSGGGAGRTLFAAVIGGLVAVAGAAGLQWLGVLPAPDRGSSALLSGISANAERLDQIEAEVGSIPDQIKAVQELVNEAGSGVSAASSEALDALKSELASMQETVSGLQSAVSEGGAGETAALAQLSSRLDEMAKTVADQVNAASAPVDLGPVNEALEAQQSKMVEVATAVSEITEALSATSARLDDLSGQVAVLSEKVSGQQAQPAMARAIAAAALKSAIDRGTPFMAELETFAAVTGGEDENITALRDLAASGVPTIADLQKQFASDASGIIDAATVLPENSTIADRLLSSARSLVKARPVGEVEGDNAAAVVARMEAALNKGDLETMLAEAKALPEASAAEASGILAAVKARQTANRIVSESVSGALTSGSASSQ